MFLFPFSFHTKDGRVFSIRPSEIDDRASIIANINTVTAEGIYLQTDHFVSTPDWENIFNCSNNPGAGQLLILPVLDGKITGHLRVFPGSYGQRDRHIGSIGISLLSSYRELGIGSALLECAMKWSRQARFEKVEAFVIASNQRARGLFEKHGFVIEAIRKKQIRIYGDYKDEIIMTRVIDS